MPRGEQVRQISPSLIPIRRRFDRIWRTDAPRFEKAPLAAQLNSHRGGSTCSPWPAGTECSVASARATVASHCKLRSTRQNLRKPWFSERFARRDTLGVGDDVTADLLGHSRRRRFSRVPGWHGMLDRAVDRPCNQPAFLSVAVPRAEAACHLCVKV
jgi:hypothetical protein